MEKVDCRAVPPNNPGRSRKAASLVQLLGIHLKLMDEDNHAHSLKDIEYHAKTAYLYDRVVTEPRAYANNLLFSPIDRLVPQAGAMLDLGCGTGQMLLRYASRFKCAVGVDHSPQMLDIAAERLARHGVTNARLKQTDVLAFLGNAGDRFDLVTCVGCLHHLAAGGLEEFFRLVRSAVAPRGQLLVAEPIVNEGVEEPTLIRKWNEQSVMPELAGLVHQVDVEEADEAPIQREKLDELGRRSGFRLVCESRGWEMFPRTVPPSVADRIVLRYLHLRYGNSGNILAQLWEAD